MGCEKSVISASIIGTLLFCRDRCGTLGWLSSVSRVITELGLQVEYHLHLILDLVGPTEVFSLVCYAAEVQSVRLGLK